MTNKSVINEIFIKDARSMLKNKLIEVSNFDKKPISDKKQVPIEPFLEILVCRVLLPFLISIIGGFTIKKLTQKRSNSTIEPGSDEIVNLGELIKSKSRKNISNEISSYINKEIKIINSNDKEEYIILIQYLLIDLSISREQAREIYDLLYSQLVLKTGSKYEQRFLI